MIITRVYEFNVMNALPKQAVVKAGYQRFRKATNGFNFRYPIGWRYEPIINNDNFISGRFYDAQNKMIMYLEAPYSGQEFLFNYQGAQPFYSENITSELYPVRSVTSSYILTNDQQTPILFNTYRKCRVFTSSTCAETEPFGGFMTAVWQRGRGAPVLSDRNVSAQTGVLYATLPVDINQEKFRVNQFITLLQSFRFNNVGDTQQTAKSRWSIYHNTPLNYSFLYPSDFSINEDADLAFAFMTTGTILAFPENFSTGTNLSEAKLLFGNVDPKYAESDCLPQNGIGSVVEEVTINGTKFLRDIGAGAAAGNRFDTITYALKRPSGCFNITLYLHSTVLENYPPELRPNPFDRSAIVSTFNDIISTFIIK